ncbi:hypothetical protein EDF58_101584 [Novosphingobium sp. PhB57]|uniref:DUF6338 family protein n=1 Tax=Novosphingobium sp. PhB57 TaxID=2485107 RepID=UPI001052C2CF|nr:DUF6338 family protein [Novosphingobium sp. PhB57]TCU61270.1 hypothetical protein EDF58_101584 [Novosphingobium sp. PhB57]
MTELDPEKLRLFWFFAMPGVIILYVRAQFLTGRMPSAAEGLIAYLVVSIVYHALLFPVASPLYGVAVTSFGGGVGWFAYILAGPAAAGVISGLAAQRGWIRNILNSLKFNKLPLRTVHSIPSAWDWKFSQCTDCFVMVVLKDATKWAGYLGEQSFISSAPAERDIFLEKVYEIDPENNWIPRTSGVWIGHGEIQSIEFWPNAQGGDDA